jgi:murein DD-endopeptidase MepM/ murein hydrolase activator NlpD/uncharacterized protein YegL
MQSRFRGRASQLTTAFLFLGAITIGILSLRPSDNAVAARLAASPSPTPIDLVLILDESGSVTSVAKPVKEEAQDFITNLHLECNAHIQVAVVIFAQQARTTMPLTNDVDKLRSAIDLAGRGSTRIETGFTEARKVLTKARPNSTRAVVLVSDGQNNNPCADAASAAKSLGASVRRYALCVSGDCLTECMRDKLASEKKFFRTAESRGKLKEAFQDVASDFRSPNPILHGIVNVSGKPKSAVALIATGPNGHDRAETNDQGYYQMLRLRPGTYWLWTYAQQGEPPVQEYVDVSSGCTRHDITVGGLEVDEGYHRPVDDLKATFTSYFDHEYPVRFWKARPTEDVQPNTLLYNGLQVFGNGNSGHAGIDIGVYKKPVYAARSGTVHDCDQFDGTGRGFGTCVELHHDDGNLTRYAHLSAKSPVGTSVIQGQQIGVSGNSGVDPGRPTKGYHLHFEIVTMSFGPYYRFDPFGWTGDPKDDPWVTFGPPSHDIFTDDYGPAALLQTDVQGRVQDGLADRTQSSSPDPFLRGTQPILPDEQLVHVSPDKSLTITLGVGTFVHPAVIRYERIAEGDPEDSDSPPIAPIAVHSYAILNIRAVDATADSPIEPQQPITIEMRSIIETGRQADLSTLRIIREFGSHQVPVPGVVQWDEDEEVATSNFTITQMGSYRLVASAILPPTPHVTATMPTVTVTASSTTLPTGTPSPSATVVAPWNVYLPCLAIAERATIDYSRQAQSR